MVSNPLKRWWDDFATVKRQRDGFGAFRKETGSHPAPPQVLCILHCTELYSICYREFSELRRKYAIVINYLKH
jgi:hypothetical protein